MLGFCQPFAVYIVLFLFSQPSTSSSSTFQTILNHHIHAFNQFFDKDCQELDGKPKGDEIRTAVVLDLDEYAANLSQLDLHKQRIRINFDEEEQQFTLTAKTPNNIVKLQKDGKEKVEFAIKVNHNQLFGEPQKVEPLKTEPENAFAPILARPNLKNTIMKRLGKWSRAKRAQWLNVLKYRYLRRKHLRLNKNQSKTKIIQEQEQTVSGLLCLIVF